MKKHELVVFVVTGFVLMFGFSFISCRNQSSRESLSDISIEENNSVLDADGNSYKVVKIGDQLWMNSNLCTTHYADGTGIEKTTTCMEESPKYYKDSKTGEFYYNGYAAVQKICPKGWHVSSKNDWLKLEDYLAKEGYYCGKVETQVAKALASTEGWWNSDDGECVPGFNRRTTNNATGFNALPKGFVMNWRGEGIKIYDDEIVAIFWTSNKDMSKSKYDEHEHKSSVVMRTSDACLSAEEKDCVNYMSVRCVRDDK